MFSRFFFSCRHTLYFYIDYFIILFATPRGPTHPQAIEQQTKACRVRVEAWIKKMHAIKTRRNHLKLIIFFCSFFFTFKLKLELLVFTISEYLIKMNRIFFQCFQNKKVRKTGPNGNIFSHIFEMKRVECVLISIQK